MTTPPGLLGATVLFWGWETGLLLFAAPIAAGLEASRVASWRWDLSPRDVRRIADLSRVILAGMAMYLYATRGSARTVLGLIEWFPLAVLPLLVCQAYGVGNPVDLRTFALILRRRRGDDDETLDVAWPYLAVCVAAASAANVRGPAFYLGLCSLAAWALWPVRSRAFGWPAWLGILVLAGVAGYVGQAGLHELQGVVEGVMTDFIADPSRRELDPFRTHTAMGAIGRLKLSGRVLLRVEPGEGPRPAPLLLHEAAYDVYNASIWGAVDAAFEPVPPPPDRRTWDLGPPAAASRPGSTLTVSAYSKRGRSMVPVPNGTFRIEGLLAVQMKRNRLGALKVEETVGLVSYRTRSADGFSLGRPPSPTDVQVPRAEMATITRIAAELGLGARPPREALDVLARYLAARFRYATYLEGARRGTTALEDFLLRTHAGHCEYFATATVLLLRAAGIPARYATGYSVQEWSPRERRYLVRARHGHSWALAYVDGAWRDFDTTPPVWASAEAEQASFWAPLADLASWAMFLFSRWRWSDQDPNYARYAGWALLPLVAFLAWRLSRQRRVARAGPAGGPELTPSVPPGADSEFYQIEAHLAARGVPRRPWEPVGRWLGRLRTDRLDGVDPAGLDALAALHSRYRFDPHGLPPGEREALRTGVRDWLERHHERAG